MARNTIELVAGDRLESIYGTYLGKNLAGCAFNLVIDYSPAGIADVVKNAVIVNPDPAVASFRFDWDAGDLKAGKWNASIQYLDPSLKRLTFAGLILNIRPSYTTP